MSRCDGALIFALARTFFSGIDFNKYHDLLSEFTPNQIQAIKEMVISGSKHRAATVARVAAATIAQWLASDTPFQRTYGHIRDAEEREAERHGSRVELLPTPYNHLEGALAIAQQLPVFILAEENMERSGILYYGGGIKSTIIPAQADQRWVESEEFQGPFNAWAQQVQKRRDVFMGYCSQANATATAIRDYLEDEGFRVLDWARDFATAGPTILEEMSRAANTCRCAIFLFTKDDRLTGKATEKAVPRDNVLLEAGYFIQARGKERVAIVREKGVKMPADLGGVIYLSLEEQSSLSSIQKRLAQFLTDAINKYAIVD